MKTRAAVLEQFGAPPQVQELHPGTLVADHWGAQLDGSAPEGSEVGVADGAGYEA